ncbi:MAG: hypothetical protein ACLU84_01850 [Clostridia bacterium]
MVQIQHILRCFPLKIYKKLEELFSSSYNSMNNLEEIRMRVNKPIILKIGQTEKMLEYNVSQEEILEIMQHICDNSIYSYQNQICKRIYYYAGRT